MNNRPIRWGILGTGWIAGEFAQGLRQLPDAEILAVGSRAVETAERFARQHQVQRAYGSYEALVTDNDIDVIYIATPHITHRDHCILALEADKAVLCEKPFTLTAQEAHEVIALARQKQLFCMEAMWMRFTPAMRKVRELVDANAIGNICLINANLGFRVDYDPTHRAFNRALGGGALLDLGVYPLSFIVQLLGVPNTITTHATMGETGVDEQAAVILGYDQGQIATLMTSLRTFNPNDAVIMGTTGQIHLHEPLYCPEALSLRHYSLTIGQANSGTTRSNGASTTMGITARLRQMEQLRKLYHTVRPLLNLVRGAPQERIKVPAAGNGYQYEAAEVMDCLRRGAVESSIMPLEETLQIMGIMDTIRQQWPLAYPQETAYA